LPAGGWPTIAAFLVHRFSAVAPAVWAARIGAGEVVDENGAAVTPTRPYEARLRVYYYREVPAEAPLPFNEAVLFADAHIVVADKPHFMPVTPGGDHLHETLLVRLKRQLGIDTLVPIHRIDRETAGLVLFAIDPLERGRYQQLFAERSVQKSYECIAPWRGDLPWPLDRETRIAGDPAHFMRMVEAEGAPNSKTTIEPLEQRGPVARYRLVPLTGRRHQLRVHCAALGMPIAGDRIYPALLPAHTDDVGKPLQLLARSLAFSDPVTGEPRHFETSLRLQSLQDHQ
jgi:tRNA pseudouridine32 synthase / 23S rRNA pseudouridine746 synthase